MLTEGLKLKKMANVIKEQSLTVVGFNRAYQDHRVYQKHTPHHPFVFKPLGSGALSTARRAKTRV